MGNDQQEQVTKAVETKGEQAKEQAKNYRKGANQAGKNGKVVKALKSYVEAARWDGTPEPGPSGIRDSLRGSREDTERPLLPADLASGMATVNSALVRLQPYLIEATALIFHWYDQNGIRGFRLTEDQCEIATRLRLDPDDVVLLWWHKIWSAVSEVVR